MDHVTEPGVTFHHALRTLHVILQIESEKQTVNK